MGRSSLARSTAGTPHASSAALIFWTAILLAFGVAPAGSPGSNSQPYGAHSTIAGLQALLDSRSGDLPNAPLAEAQELARRLLQLDHLSEMLDGRQ
eukprot:COSAG05_NODE_5315_length_1208_cov_2.402164_2_plen_96_part_00